MKARNSGEITWFPKNWCESWISSWSFPLLKHWLFLPQLCAIIIDTENYQAKIFLKVWVSSLTKLFVSTNVLKRTVCVRGDIGTVLNLCWLYVFSFPQLQDVCSHWTVTAIQTSSDMYSFTYSSVAMISIEI